MSGYAHGARAPLLLALLVLLAHGLLLWALTRRFSRPLPPVTPPALVGVLVSPPAATPPAAPAPPPAAPKPPPPKPAPVATPKPKPAPKPVPSAAPDAHPRAPRRPSEPPDAPPRAPLSASAATAEAAAPPPNAADNAPPAPPLVQPRADAAFLQNPAPRYPPRSRRLGEQGLVWLDVLILADGRVAQVRLKRSSGYPALNQAAIEAVRQWRYVPATQGGTALDYWHVQPLDFSLQQAQ